MTEQGPSPVQVVGGSSFYTIPGGWLLAPGGWPLARGGWTPFRPGRAAGFAAPFCSDLLHIDLRALEFAAEIDVDRLPLREHVKRRCARFPMAVVGGLGSSKWQVH